MLRQTQNVKLIYFSPTCLLASVHLTSIFAWHRTLSCHCCQARTELQDVKSVLVWYIPSAGTPFFRAQAILPIYTWITWITWVNHLYSVNLFTPDRTKLCKAFEDHFCSIYACEDHGMSYCIKQFDNLIDLTKRVVVHGPHVFKLKVKLIYVKRWNIFHSDQSWGFTTLALNCSSIITIILNILGSCLKPNCQKKRRNGNPRYIEPITTKRTFPICC